LATFVDSLLLELNLDATKFVRAQKEVDTSLKRTKETFVKHGKDIEQGAKTASQFVDDLTRRFLGLGAAIYGMEKVKGLIDKFAKMDTATSRMAYNIGLTAQQLKNWQGAATETGVSAENASSGLKSLSDNLAAWKAGHPSDQFAEFISRLSINKELPINEQMLQISDRLKQIAEKDGPAVARWFASQAGINEEFFSVLVKGSDALQKVFAGAEARNKISKEDEELQKKRQTAYAQLQETLESLGRTTTKVFGDRSVEQAYQQMTEAAHNLDRLLGGDTSVFAEAGRRWEDLLNKLYTGLGRALHRGFMTPLLADSSAHSSGSTQFGKSCLGTRYLGLAVVVALLLLPVVALLAVVTRRYRLGLVLR
jgi:hypothetical protein